MGPNYFLLDYNKIPWPAQGAIANGDPADEVEFNRLYEVLFKRTDILKDLLAANYGGGGNSVESVIADNLTVTGNGIAQPLTTPGYSSWIGRFWRRDAGKEQVLDTTQHPDRFVKLTALDITNFTVGGVSQGFNAVFQGLVTPKYTEDYTLIYYVDDGCRIYLDDVLVVDNWANPAPSDSSVKRSADLGLLVLDRPYLMRVEWYQMAAGADTTINPNRLYIGWQSSSQTPEAIPTIGAATAGAAAAASVQHDSSLTGDGTTGSPLAVNSTLLTRIAALEGGTGGSGGMATVAVTANLRGNGLAASPLDVSPEIGGLARRVRVLEQVAGTALKDPALSRSTTPGPKYDFATFVAGNIDGQQGFTGLGTITNGQLYVPTTWNSNLGTKLPFTFAEGEYLLELDAANPYIMLRTNTQASGRSYGVWIYSGNEYESGPPRLDCGIVDAAQVVSSVGTGTPTALDITKGNLMLRFVVEPTRLLAWAWPKSEAMPVAPVIAFTSVASYPLGRGNAYLSRVYASNSTRTEARVVSLTTLQDQEGDSDIEQQADFTGRWFYASGGGQTGMATITQGSEFAVRVSGSDLSADIYRDPNTSQTPIFAVSVNGAASKLVQGPTATGWQKITLATGLTAGDDVRVIVDGLHELDPVWQSRAALIVGNLYSTGGSTIPVPAPDQPIMVQFGDSITAGVMARSASGSTLPQNSAASLTWGRIAAAQAGYKVVQAGYGGTSLKATNTGSGGVAGTLGNVVAYWARHEEPNEPYSGAKVITINIGTNDNNRGVSAADFQADYVTLLGLLRARFPQAQILALRPFGGYYAAQIQAAVQAVNDPNAQYVDTTGWVSTFTDGLHPDVAGHAAAGAKLAPYLLQANGGAVYQLPKYQAPVKVADSMERLSLEDDGTNPPRLVYTRLDGTVWYGQPFTTA